MMATLPVSVIKMHNVGCETHTNFMKVRASSETQRGWPRRSSTRDIRLSGMVCLSHKRVLSEGRLLMSTFVRSGWQVHGCGSYDLFSVPSFEEKERRGP